MIDPTFLQQLFSQFAMKNPGVIGPFDFLSQQQMQVPAMSAMMGYTPKPGAGLPPLPRPAVPSIGQLAQPVAQVPLKSSGGNKGDGGASQGGTKSSGRQGGVGGFGGFT